MDKGINDNGGRNDSRNGIENDHLDGQTMTTKTTQGTANNDDDDDDEEEEEEAANSKWQMAKGQVTM